MKKIKIKAGNIKVKGELKETSLAEKIFSSLPFSSKANIWGDEIYFEIPVDENVKNGVKDVEKGDIAYWPDGKCMCLFFGQTPISHSGKIIPASEVEVLGKITEGIENLKEVSAGEEIVVEKE